MGKEKVRKTGFRTRMGGWKIWLVLVMLARLSLAAAGTLTTTTIQDTVYRADGTVAAGTLIVSWPAFTTAANAAVAAGSVTVPIGADGLVTLNLAPNAGAYPGGTYYTAVYHLNDGTVNKEYWVVPAAASTTIGAVRSVLTPATVAIQAVNKQYVDTAVSSITGNYVSASGATMTGPLTLAADPTAPLQAATKEYVDSIPGNASAALAAANAAQATANAALPASKVGAAGGAAPLDSTSRVPAGNMPVSFAVSSGSFGAGITVTGGTTTDTLTATGAVSAASLASSGAATAGSFTTGGGLTAASVSAGTVTSSQVNKVFYADGHPSTGCTVGGTVYTTQLDCAAATAVAWITANNSGAKAGAGVGDVHDLFGDTASFAEWVFRDAVDSGGEPGADDHLAELPYYESGDLSRGCGEW
jgi:hypothetical protein